MTVNYGGLSNGDGTVGILLGNGDGSFRTVVRYDAGGGGPFGIAVGDLNGDGKPDLVVATQGCLAMSTNCLSVLLGIGDGTFKPAVPYSRGIGVDWGLGPGMLAPVMIGDINGDSKADLVVVNQTHSNFGDGQVGVLLGNGDGTFKPIVTYDTGGFAAFSGFLLDVNGDGKSDVVVLNCSSSGSTDCGHDGVIGVLLGNGDGTFKKATTYDSGGLGGTTALAIADVNGDGKPDILVGNGCPGNCVGVGSFGVLMNRGDGTFQGVVTYPLTGVGGVESIAVGDLNGDGKPDLAMVGNGIDAWLNKGDGTFQFSDSYPTTGNTQQVLLTDLDGDGKLDFVDNNITSNTADARLGNGDGTFQSIQTFKLGGQQISWTTIADVNGDGRPDLISANWCSPSCQTEEGSVGVLLNVALFPNPTSTTLVSSLNPSFYGQRVTFTAKVANIGGTAPPTGQVVFKGKDIYGNTFAIGRASLDGSGVAILIKSNLSAIPYQITAVYLGDALHQSKAASAMTNSVRFPRVALSSPPTASPVRVATDSVARLSSVAKGMIANTARMNSSVCDSGLSL